MPGVAFSSVPASDLGLFFSESTAFSRSISSSSSSSSSLRCCSPFNLRSLRSLRSPKFSPICCDSSSHGSSSTSPDLEFLQASVLVADKYALQNAETWIPPRFNVASFQASLPPFAVRASDSESTTPLGVLPIGLGFLRQFKHPTIFLKISCDGDYLLPLIVGDAAVEKLLDVAQTEECPDQFQFVSAVVDRLGYEVKMVKLTSRVVNTYYASLCLGKPGDNDVICFDSRPSDAINVARSCQAPIYVNKAIVLEEAIKIGYGGRSQSAKPVFNVILDSAPEGPDPLSEELKLVRNMDLASKEERYMDAAMWRDKLKKLQNSSSAVYNKGVATPESYE